MAKQNSTSVSRRLRKRKSTSSKTTSTSKKKSSRRRVFRPAEGPQTAKITFTNVRTGKTTTQVVKVRRGGGSGTSLAPVRRVAPQLVTTKQATITTTGRTGQPLLKPSDERRRSAERQRRLTQQQEERRKQFEEAQAKRLRDIKATPKQIAIEKEQEAIRKITGRVVTRTGEQVGVFGKTRKERQDAAKTFRVVEAKSKALLNKGEAQRLNAVITRLGTGQLPSLSGLRLLSKASNLSAKELTIRQTRALLATPKDIGLGVFEVGKEIVTLPGKAITGAINLGKSLARQANKQGRPVLNVVNERLVNVQKAGENIQDFIIKNPETAFALASAFSKKTAKGIEKDLLRNPVKATSKLVTEVLSPVALTKGLRLTKALTAKVNLNVFSPSKIKSLTNQIAQLKGIKAKTRGQIEDIRILEQQLKVDQELKFLTGPSDDIAKLPKNQQEVLKEARKGIATKQNRAIRDGKAPKTGEAKANVLVNKQKALTEKQKRKKFRKEKAKGVTPLRPETQAKKIGELFRDTKVKEINQRSKVKITEPEVKVFSKADRSVKNLEARLKDLNEKLAQPITEGAKKRIGAEVKRNTDLLKKAQSQLEAIKLQVVNAPTVAAKKKLIQAADSINKVLRRIAIQDRLSLNILKLERKLGISEEAFKNINKLTTVQTQKLITDKSFFTRGLAEAVSLRNQFFKSAGFTESQLIGLNNKIMKLLGKGRTVKVPLKKQQKIRVSKDLLTTFETRKIPQNLEKVIKKRDLKGLSIDDIRAKEIADLKKFRNEEIVQGKKRTDISKQELKDILINPSFKDKVVKKINELQKDINTLKASVSFLDGTAKDLGITKSVRVAALNEQGRIRNLIPKLQGQIKGLQARLKVTRKPVSQIQTAERQRLFASRVDKSKKVSIKTRPIKPDTNTFKVSLGEGIELEFEIKSIFAPGVKASLRKSKRASTSILQKIQKPSVKVRFRRKTSIEQIKPESFDRRVRAAFIKNPFVKRQTNKIALVKNQQQQLENIKDVFGKQLKPSTKNKINTTLKDLNKIENSLQNSMRNALANVLGQTVDSFIKSTLKITPKVEVGLKKGLVQARKLLPAQQLKQVVQQVNSDIVAFEKVKVPVDKPRVPTTKRVSKVTKLPTPPKPLTLQQKLLKAKKKPVTKEPPGKKPPTPPLTLDFDTPLPRGTRLKFDAKFRERRNASIPFNRKTNPVIVKTRKLGLPMNAAMNKIFGGVDRSTQASAQLVISGITKAKDMKASKRLRAKFGISKTKNALRFVEKNKNRIDTQGEKRGLALSRALAPKKRKPKTKSSKKKRSVRKSTTKSKKKSL